MKTFETIKEIKPYLTELKQAGLLGFVPTMGALHDGHLQLIKKCYAENDYTVVSIFVNPTQFNDKKDLQKYPRNIDEDLKKIYSINENIVVFIPDATEIYPDENSKSKIYDLNELDKYMEGAHRPGHFNGVAMVVDKLFQIVEPNNAYFGEKDFQQLAIIKYLVKQKKIDINITACPTIREKNNLAMSSRNLLLTPETREKAGIIYKTLVEAVELKNKLSVSDVKKWVEDTIVNTGFLELEYFELVNIENLRPVGFWEDAPKIQGCIAVKTEGIRLIDNIKFYS